MTRRVLPKEPDCRKFDEDVRVFCKICFENEIDILVLHCRHLFSCGNCSLSLKYCAICRTKIEAALKVFQS